MSRINNKPTRRSNNTTTGISKRTGLSRDEIQRMRREAYQDAKENPSIDQDLGYISRPTALQPKKELDPFNLKKDPPRSSPTNPIIKKIPISVEIQDWRVKGASFNAGLGSIGYGTEGIKGSIGLPGLGLGLGVTYDPKTGNGNVELPGGIKITFKREGCFVVETRTLLNQYMGSNIQKDPSCSSDDDDNNSNEPKPPHCTGSDGKPGKGEPKNLYPECLEGSTGIFTFYYITSLYDERKSTYHTNSTNSTYEYGFNFKEFDFENSRIKGVFINRATVTYSDGSDGSYDNGDPDFNYSFSQIGVQSFIGTYAEFKSMAEESVPEPIDITETRENRFIGTYTYSEKKKWWMFSGVPGIGCNPTGDEGCGGGSNNGDNGGNPGKNNPPRIGKPPDKLERDRDKDREDEDMKCCEETKELLLLVLDHVGYNLSPIEVPSSLTDDDNVEQVVLPNIPSFLIWQFGRWDEVTGKFPQTIEIEDANPMESGNQPETITLHNQAEAFAELYGEIMTVLQQQQILLEVCFKGLLTSGLNRESGIRTEKLNEAIIDYLGFGIKEKEVKIPQLFNAFEDSEEWGDVLKETKSTVRVVEIDDKANLQLSLAELAQAASVIRGRYFTKVNPATFASDTMRDMKASLSVLGRVGGIVKGDSKDWEQFQKWVNSMMPESEINPEVDYWSR